VEEQKAGIRIGKRAFITAAVIILALMLVAGVLTRVIPTGAYERAVADGRESIVADSFRYTEAARLPIWRWFTAPVEVLWGPDSTTVIVIILFILIIGGTFTLLDRCGMLRWLMGRLASRFRTRRYTLLALMVFFFMFFGSAFGMFEELVALVPIVVMLSYALGWDSLVGLGMSALAVGFGFSSATLNPFTIGVAQTLAGLPAFSGVLLRIPIFIITYAVLYLFIRRYAKKLDADPKRSLVYEADAPRRARYADGAASFGGAENERQMKRSAIVFGISLGLVLLYIIAGLVCNTLFGITALSDISMPVMAVLFLVGGIIAAAVSQYTQSDKSAKGIFRDFLAGIGGVAPGALLILMAMSVKHIVTTGGVMDTILYGVSNTIEGLGPSAAALLIFGLVLVLNFFIGSASAKAFLVVPLIMPLTELVGITRQVAVQAFCFGDGFSNMIFPTNAVLMIALSLTVVSYPKWFRWTWKLQLIMLALCALIIVGLVAIGYGPF